MTVTVCWVPCGRSKMREHMDALEKYREMTRETAEEDRAALEREREAARREVAGERDRLERLRVEQHRRGHLLGGPRKGGYHIVPH